MGCIKSKSSSSSSVYRRSSSSSEKTQSRYAPSAPSLDTINSLCDNTLGRRDEECSSNPKRQKSDAVIAAYKKRNDCMFYYYTKCTKGDKCAYRHEPTALRSKRVCPLWKDNNKCFDKHCQFRHMTLQNNKKLCFWEERDGKCQVELCPFKHSKSEDKQDNNDASKSKDKKENNENKPKVYTHRRQHEHGPLDKSSDLSKFNEVEVGDSSATQEKVKEEHKKLANMKLEEKRNEIIKKMERVLNCCICFELFVSPVTLNCSHTFCQFCIKEWRKDNVNCPLCRNNITSEARALNIENLIKEMMPDFPEEMKQKREKVIRLRKIRSSLPY